MSFIDLMANDIWSDADITKRTESMIRSEFSAEAETILNRKVAGISLGQYEPTDEDLAEMARFKVVVDNAQAEGVAARKDMALLLQVLTLEENIRKLNDAPLPEEGEEPTVPVDPSTLIDNAPDDVKALYNLRNPSNISE